MDKKRKDRAVVTMNVMRIQEMPNFDILYTKKLEKREGAEVAPFKGASLCVLQNGNMSPTEPK